MTFITLEELQKCFVCTSELTHQMGSTAEVWWGPVCNEHAPKQPLHQDSYIQSLDASA